MSSRYGGGEKCERYRSYSAECWSVTSEAHDVVAEHIAHMLEEVSEILRDGAKAGDWSVKSADAAAGMVLNATSRFHHPVMVQLDGGRSDLKELDALMDVLIAGLQARG
ncbi:MAG TPA: hypothetical protein PLH23_08165 [Hyphomonadaceae bacterium]|nr:hypothetical protein [Hyphomonadaceae bacterium]